MGTRLKAHGNIQDRAYGEYEEVGSKKRIGMMRI
jgi:hypothetical protein